MPYKQKLVAAASLEDGAKQFVDQSGKSATSLDKNAKTFGVAAKVLGGFGVAYSAYGESLFIQKVSIKSPNKVNMAVASSAVNIIGDTATTAAFATQGAAWGALTGPLAPIAVPVLAVGFGIAGHFIYEFGWKEIVRDSYVGKLPK